MNSEISGSDWQRAHGAVLIGGQLRKTPEDFFVAEMLGFEPDNLGEHDLLHLEKRNTNTQWLARQLASYAKIAVRDVGFSGMKDRNALTRQWFSVRRPDGGGTDWPSMSIDKVKLLEVSRNSRKLRHGAHAGNQFRIVVRDVSGEIGGIDERLSRIREKGVPNYFGEQRFGHGGRNIQLAGAFFSGKRLPREKRSIAISAARSWIFNHMLQERVLDGSWDQLEPGDVAALDGSSSVFQVEALDDALRTRLLALDIHPTGVLWGKASAKLGPTAAEQKIAERFAELSRGLVKHADMAHRATRLNVRDLQWSLEDRSLSLQFSLSRGCYATAVLREIVRYNDKDIES